MARFRLTATQEEFIKGNYKKMSRNDMAKKMNIGVTPISTFMKKNNLSVSKEQSRAWAIAKTTGRTSFTVEEDNFIKEYYLKLPVKTIAKKLNRSHTGIELRLKNLKLEIPYEIIAQRKAESRFKKGHTPSNKGMKQTEYMSEEAIAKTKKTRFKKGHTPGNTYKSNGVVSKRKDKNGRCYLYIRISKGVWKPFHTHLWEENFGPIPESHCLWFKDRNTLNCDLDNLEVISRAENIARNRSSHHKLPKEVKQTIRLKNKLIKAINNKI